MAGAPFIEIKKLPRRGIGGAVNLSCFQQLFFVQGWRMACFERSMEMLTNTAMLSDRYFSSIFFSKVWR